METTMEVPVSKAKMWSGRIASALVILFMLFDAAIHIAQPQFVQDSFKSLGYDPHVGPILGVIVLVSVILYIIPRTAILGAILLTGYLGGAVATNFRLNLSLFGNILFPVYVGILLWGGLWLRDTKLSALVPIRK